MLPKILKTFRENPIETVVVAAAFAGLAVVYLTSTAATATGVADSDELITSAYLLSPAHPPGYGLNILLIALFQRLLFFVNPAQASHILAAVLHWMTLFVIYLWARMVLTQFYPKALAVYVLPGMVLFGLSPLFWRYASVIEVMSLGNLLAAATLYFASKWWITPKGTYLLLTAVLFGLGVSHLQTIVLFGPGLLLLFGYKRWKTHDSVAQLVRMSGSAMGWVFIGFLMGVLVLIPLNNQRADFAWDFPASANGLWRMVSRADYAGYSLESDTEITNAYIGSLGAVIASLRQIPWYAKFTWNYFHGPLILLVLVPLYMAWRKKSVLLTFSIIQTAVAGILLGTYVTIPRPDDYQLRYVMLQAIAERQYLIGYIPLAFLFTIGIAYVLARYRITPTAVGAAVLLLTVASYTANREFGSMSDYHIVRDVYQAGLMSVEPNAVILCSSDTACYTLYYLSLVERVRPDVTILTYMTKSRRYFLERHPEFVGYRYDNEPYFYAQLIAWNVYHRPTYLTNIDAYYVDYVGLDGNPFYLQPGSLLYKVSLNTPTNLTTYKADTGNLFQGTRTDSRDFYSIGIQNYLANHFDISGRLAARAGQPDLARDYFEYAVTLNNKEGELIDWMLFTEEYGDMLGYANREATPAATLLTQALAADAAGKAEEAYNLARKSFYMQPTTPAPLELLVKLYRQHNFAEAADITKKHLEELVSN